MPARLIVVGGFLGAGKTSAILRLANSLTGMGRKIGIVTNDQSENLVDTNFLAGEGKTVVEVTGGCFCCNFDEFAMKLRSLSRSEFPDIILAEPVGSCTDLIATIFKPIMNDFTREFTLAPLSVLADPRRIKKYMTAEKAGIINEINYLFDRQLSEADIILINKCDLLTGGERDEISSFLKGKYRGAEVICVSALTGEGFDRLLDAVLRREAPQKPSYEIDYDIYAKAEAALGWYNGFAVVRSQKKENINAFIASLLGAIRDECAVKKLNIAHLKTYAVTELDHAKASVTAADEPAAFQKKAEFEADCFNLILNARIEAEPCLLERICETALKTLAASSGMTITDYKADCFAPSYPRPKHRMP